MPSVKILSQRWPIRLHIANTVLEQEMLFTRAAIRGLQLDGFHELAEPLAQAAVAHRSKLLEISDDHDIRRVWLFLHRLEQPRPLQIVILRCLVAEDSLILPETRGRHEVDLIVPIALLLQDRVYGVDVHTIDAIELRKQLL